MPSWLDPPLLREIGYLRSSDFIERVRAAERSIIIGRANCFGTLGIRISNALD
jgi:hypothetical protein